MASSRKSEYLPTSCCLVHPAGNVKDGSVMYLAVILVERRLRTQALEEIIGQDPGRIHYG
jgi:hypothetical protein